MLDELTARLGPRCRAEVHGQVLGSGLEMAAYCGWVQASPDAVLGLPELSLGLIPGAGGTVSITRRIGRWRTAYLVLSGQHIDAATALRWGLVDAVGRRAAPQRRQHLNRETLELFEPLAPGKIDDELGHADRAEPLDDRFQ